MPKNLSNKATPPKDWHKAVCRSPSTLQSLALGGYVLTGPHNELSPIDRYLTATEGLLKLGSPKFFTDNPQLANLLLVGVVSEAENYFRELFSQLLALCPISQGKSSQREIKLGSVLWYRVGKMERGAFEHFSFAAMDNIVDTLSRYFDIQVDQKSDPYTLLQQFDLLCEIRHAIVHSASLLSGKNATKLHLANTTDCVTVNVDFHRFQEATQLCTELVCSINILLFRKFAERWRDKWPTCSPSWTTREANKRFKKIWVLFSSSLDQANGLPTRSLSMKQCRREILAP